MTFCSVKMFNVATSKTFLKKQILMFVSLTNVC